MNASVKILLIDANVADAIGIRQKLAESKSATFSTRMASTLAQGLEMLGSQRFDIALVDSQSIQTLSMPRLTALHAIAAETPFIILSRTFQESEALEAVRAGAQDYVVKNRLNAAALERILLYAMERHTAQKRTALQYSISRVLAAAATMQEAQKHLLRVFGEFIRFEVGQVWHYDRTTDTMHCAQSWHSATGDFSDFIAVSRDLRLKPGDGLPGRVWSSGTPAWIADVTKDPNFPRARVAAAEHLRAGFAFPIRVGDETLAVMEFFARESRDRDSDLFDVTEDIAQQVGQFMARKLAEEEKTIVTNERLMILDSASEGIYGVDLRGDITFMNRSAASMFACSPADAIGKNSHRMFHHSHLNGDPYSVQDCPLTRALASGEETQVDDELFWRLDGSGFAVHYSTHPLTMAGKITGAVVCFSDISERKRLEIELRHAQKLESVGALAAGIAHEINTPIQFIGDNTRFLQDAFRDAMPLVEAYEKVCEEAATGGARNESIEQVRRIRKKIDWDYMRGEVPRAIQQMHDGIGRVAKIVRAMKEFSHVDRSAEKAQADINRALESTLIVARNELKHVAEVSTDLGDLPLVRCHLGDLNQVFLNLLVNAAQAIGDVVAKTGQRGRIAVRTRAEGDSVEVAISDTGTGIPESIRNKIFDPFFTTKEVGKGTGQGLALARAIVVDRHGGTLTFETEVGRGTTFYVRLPMIDMMQPREAVAK
jgi:PAS domain S-box-containing protein